MAASRSVGTSARGCAVDGADQGDLERQPRGVRATAHPCRAAGRRRADRRQASRAADAPRRDRRRQPQAFGEDHQARTTSGACGAGSGGSGLQRRQWRSTVGGRHRAPRGVLEPCGGGRPPPSARRSGPVEAEGSLSRGTPGKAEAALTTTGRASTARWCGSGKRDGKVYARNQRRKAPQAKTTSSKPDRSGLGSNAHPTGTTGWRTPWLGDVAGREAMVKDCGVAMARLQGHSWPPTPLKGSRVNVGTTSSAPAIMAGKTCRRLTPAKWGGGPVVVRARESRVHGAFCRNSGALMRESGRENKRTDLSLRYFVGYAVRASVAPHSARIRSLMRRR